MILGLIGGVGSGKSTVTNLLIEKYGYTILYTDDIAKAIEEPGEAGYEALVAEFGDCILEDAEAPDASAGGKAGNETETNCKRPIDKAKFGGLIYSDPAALAKVNEIIHPLTWDYVEAQILRAREAAFAADGSVAGVKIAVETALPCERYAEMCDEIWFIYTDESARVERLMASRGYTREKCFSIIAQQLSDEEFSAYADYIIDNSGTTEETINRVQELL